MIRWLIPALLALTLVVLNLGVLIDALVYRGLRAQASQILPDDWRTLRWIQPDDAMLSALQAAQSPAQRQALDDAFGQFGSGANGPVLRLPHGLDSVEFDLIAGCFRFARHRLTFVVWHYELRLHCL